MTIGINIRLNPEQYTDKNTVVLLSGSELKRSMLPLLCINLKFSIDIINVKRTTIGIIKNLKENSSVLIVLPFIFEIKKSPGQANINKDKNNIDIHLLFLRPHRYIVKNLLVFKVIS